jgi:hypothetical protein
MYKHQVIGTRRAKSWRSRHSEHIVGVCTLEALDAAGRFASFAPDDHWKVLNGAVYVNNSTKPKEGLTPRCRYWSLEEVVGAMQCSVPRHEFYTLDPRDEQQKTNIPVYSLRGATDFYTLGPNNKEIPVYCGGKRYGLYTKEPGTRKRIPFQRSKSSLYFRDRNTGTSARVTWKRGRPCIRVDGVYEEVEARTGNMWIKTVGDAKHPGNLHWQGPTQVPCPLNGCPLPPPGVSRGDGPDC